MKKYSITGAFYKKERNRYAYVSILVSNLDTIPTIVFNRSLLVRVCCLHARISFRSTESNSVSLLLASNCDSLLLGLGTESVLLGLVIDSDSLSLDDSLCNTNGFTGDVNDTCPPLRRRRARFVASEFDSDEGWAVFGLCAGVCASPAAALADGIAAVELGAPVCASPAAALADGFAAVEFGALLCASPAAAFADGFAAVEFGAPVCSASPAAALADGFAVVDFGAPVCIASPAAALADGFAAVDFGAPVCIASPAAALADAFVAVDLGAPVCIASPAAALADGIVAVRKFNLPCLLGALGGNWFVGFFLGCFLVGFFLGCLLPDFFDALRFSTYCAGLDAFGGRGCKLMDTPLLWIFLVGGDCPSMLVLVCPSRRTLVWTRGRIIGATAKGEFDVTTGGATTGMLCSGGGS